MSPHTGRRGCAALLVALALLAIGCRGREPKVAGQWRGTVQILTTHGYGAYPGAGPISLSVMEGGKFVLLVAGEQLSGRWQVSEGLPIKGQSEGSLCLILKVQHVKIDPSGPADLQRQLSDWWIWQPNLTWTVLRTHALSGDAYFELHKG